jgi:hypothetical protein
MVRLEVAALSLLSVDCLVSSPCDASLMDGVSALHVPVPCGWMGDV